MALAVAALFSMQGLVSVGCSKKDNAGADPASGKQPAPGDVDCYKTAGATACPADPSDPSGMKLPMSGGICSLATCAVCGSATAPAFRDTAGVAKPGWCICVVKSDDSGTHIYSCLGLDEWQSR